MANLSKQRVAEIVRRYLHGHNPGGVTLDVDEAAIRREPYWWYVPVRPTEEPVKRYEYYEVLADIEAELEEREQLKVLLVPGDPLRTPVA